MKKIFTLFLFFLFANFTFAAISWMGNKAVDSQPNDSQTISFYVEMWDSYGGCHAEVGILEGGSWVTYPLSQGADNGPNSTWSAQINVKSNSTEYYFHGWDDWGAEVWDSNDGSNYAISINPTTKSGGNGNWNDSGNWCDGSVPSSTTASYIIAHNLVLNTNVTTGPLTINASASLSINATNQLTTGTITNNAGASGLVINSDATGNGSLIFTGTAPVATVERYMEGYSTDASGGWHLISSPVNNFAIESSSFEPGANDDFYAFDEGSYTWLNQKVGANSITNFTNGDGYLVARENNLTGDFSGTLNVADVSFNNLSVGTGQGWHLLGNPYPSALIFNETGASWNLVGIAGTAKV
ncbi:MAG: hypothetical protein JW729_00825 [Bacteroidales bacterium]|nr:hypothetical protein [Bacteroidales bacterium]